MKQIKMQPGYVCPCCGRVTPTTVSRCGGCAAVFDENAEPNYKWVLKTSYSWGEEESDQKCETWEEAATAMRFNAMQELLISGSEHDWQVSMYVPADIGFKKDTRSSIEIHYEYDDTYCYYVVEEY